MADFQVSDGFGCCVQLDEPSVASMPAVLEASRVRFYGTAACPALACQTCEALLACASVQATAGSAVAADVDLHGALAGHLHAAGLCRRRCQRNLRASR